MAKLPQGLPLPQMQTTWGTALDPVISNSLVQGLMLSNVKLGVGTTVVNHKLGRKLMGWMIVGRDGAAAIYDAQATNPRPELTLNLISNAAVTVSLWVF